jgi:hypothetical protein
MFKGAFEPFLGTAVCFQQHSDRTTTDATGSEPSGRSSSLEYVAKSDKRLLMKRVYLEPHTSTEPDPSSSDQN